MLNDSTISIAPARLSHSETASANLDVHFVSPSPVLSPGIAGLQPGSRSHAGAWRSQEKLWGTGGVFMKQTYSFIRRPTAGSYKLKIASDDRHGVDASVALKWFVEEIHAEAARCLLDDQYALYAPDLFW